MKEESIVALGAAILAALVAIVIFYFQIRKTRDSERQNSYKQILNEIESYAILPLPKEGDDQFVEKGNKHFASVNRTFDGLHAILYRERHMFLASEFRAFDEIYQANCVETVLSKIASVQDTTERNRINILSYEKRKEFIRRFAQLVLDKYQSG